VTTELTNPPGDEERAGPRVGHIVDRQPFGGGSLGRAGTYVVRDDEDRRHYSFDYSDIVTEGFRTIRTGERVRFLVDQVRPGRACFVIRLDLPEVEAYYP
jgi:cold shock CspA family protein